MGVKYVILGFALASMTALAQQQPANQQSDQNSQSTNTQQQSGNTKQQQNGKQSPADGNPFPEAVSKKAEDAANGAAGSSNESAPKGSSSSHVDLKRLNAPAGSDSRITDGAGGFVHDPQLAKQDDKVGKFYFDSGDYKGAYDRYKEATEVAPEDGDAVFGLAESARGLHRTQEAAANYTVYLDAFPDGKKSKEARKALAALEPGKKK